mmetsp:Transcript_37030/g.147768  ORF Transcript_37030/g.147768 Transcript_37030/m.147768 type:complete len:458 (-) Transcript_37030:2979-4352(-)
MGILKEGEIPDIYGTGGEDGGICQRRIRELVVKSGDKQVSICELDDRSRTEALLAEGVLEAEGSETVSVEIGPLREWCIEYAAQPVLWIRTDSAWYNIQSPASVYEDVHRKARRKFEMCARIYLLCTSLDQKQGTYKNLIQLISSPFQSMLGYTEEDVLEESNFILEQVQSLKEPALSSSGFVKGLRERLKKEALAAGKWVPPEEMSKVLDDRLRKRASKILGTLMKHKDCKPFLQPVNPEDESLPNYREMVKVPMDLGTVFEAYKKGMYSSIKAIVEDVRLIWNNCRAYSPEDSDVYKSMLVLEKLFETQMLLATFEEERSPAVLKNNNKMLQKSKKRENPSAGKTGEGDKKEKKKRKKKEGATKGKLSKKLDDLNLPEVEEDVEMDETRKCERPACEKNARVESKYCSDRCGLLVAYSKLRSTKNGGVDKSQAVPKASRARVLGIDVVSYMTGLT